MENYNMPSYNSSYFLTLSSLYNTDQKFSKDIATFDLKL